MLLAWDAPTQTQSAGWARYVLERRFGVPVTAVRVGSIERIDLDDFDVIVLPSGTYAPLAGERSAAPLSRLDSPRRHAGDHRRRVALGGRRRVNLLETRTELRGGRPEDG